MKGLFLGSSSSFVVLSTKIGVVTVTVTLGAHHVTWMGLDVRYLNIIGTLCYYNKYSLLSYKNDV